MSQYGVPVFVSLYCSIFYPQTKHRRPRGPKDKIPMHEVTGLQYKDTAQPPGAFDWPNFADLLGGLNGWTELASIDPAAVTEGMGAAMVATTVRGTALVGKTGTSRSTAERSCLSSMPTLRTFSR